MQWEYDHHLEKLQRDSLRPLESEILIKGTQSNNLKQSVKHSCLHPVEPWVVWCNVQGVIQLWDHQRHLCLKAFHVSSLDLLSSQPHSPSTNWKVRRLLFLDAPSLFYQFHPAHPPSPTLKLSTQSLVVVLSHKVYFYDYLQDKCHALPEKNVRQVTPIDEHYLALGYSDGHIKILDFQQWRVLKTFKGYHQKGLTFLCAYKQNENQRARLLAASKDGLIGCWNADTEGIAFKFLSKEKTYSALQYRLITLTEDNLTVWSSLSGQQLHVFKNLHQLKQVVQWNHHSFTDSLLVHQGKQQVFHLNIPNLSPDCLLSLSAPILDLRTDQSLEPSLTILDLHSHILQPSLVSIATSQGILLFSLNQSFPLSSIVFNPNFNTSLPIPYAKSIINNNKVIPLNRMQQAHILSLDQSSQFNSNLMFLFVQQSAIYCQLNDLSHLSIHPQHHPYDESVKALIYPLKQSMPWQNSELKTSFNGKYISIWNRQTGFYQILSINNNMLFKDQRELMSAVALEHLHLCSQLTPVSSGLASQGVHWHSSLEHFSIIQPLDSQGQPLKLTEHLTTIKHKASLFKTTLSHQNLLGLSSPLHSHRLLIFQIISSVELIQQLQSLPLPLTQPFSKLYSGHCFIISFNLTTQQQTDYKTHPAFSSLKQISFYFYQEDNKSYECFSQVMSEPQQIHWNTSGDIMACIYPQHLALYKASSDSLLLLHQQAICIQNLLFFENILFYVSLDRIGCMIIEGDMPILDIALASNRPPPCTIDLVTYSVRQEQKIDTYLSLFPKLQLRPPGQLYLQSVYDYQLVLIDSYRCIYRISLNHPFLQFILSLQFDHHLNCLDSALKLHPSHQPLLKQYLLSHNMQQSADSLKQLSLLHHSSPTIQQIHTYINHKDQLQIQQLIQSLLDKQMPNQLIHQTFQYLIDSKQEVASSLLDLFVSHLDDQVFDDLIEYFNQKQDNIQSYKLNPYSNKQPDAQSLKVIVDIQMQKLMSI